MMKKKEDKIPGVDRFLYEVRAKRKGKVVATVRTIARTKFEALVDAEKYFPRYETYDYDQVRPAQDDEPDGVIVTKNDLKRKK